jgi:hypothetical protein
MSSMSSRTRGGGIRGERSAVVKGAAVMSDGAGTRGDDDEEYVEYDECD